MGALDCVETTNVRGVGGYGRTSARRFGRKIWRTHVLAWIDAHGRLPAPGMEICHRCDNPPCVEPSHLFEGTKSDNQRDSVLKKRHVNAKKTACGVCGGAYVLRPNGHRDCPACKARVLKEARADPSRRERINANARARNARDTDAANARRDRDRAYKNERYASDPAFRERQIERSRQARLRKKTVS